MPFLSLISSSSLTSAKRKLTVMWCYIVHLDFSIKKILEIIFACIYFFLLLSILFRHIFSSFTRSFVQFNSVILPGWLADWLVRSFVRSFFLFPIPSLSLVCGKKREMNEEKNRFPFRYNIINYFFRRFPLPCLILLQAQPDQTSSVQFSSPGLSYFACEWHFVLISIERKSRINHKKQHLKLEELLQLAFNDWDDRDGPTEADAEKMKTATRSLSWKFFMFMLAQRLERRTIATTTEMFSCSET